MLRRSPHVVAGLAAVFVASCVPEDPSPGRVPTLLRDAGVRDAAVNPCGTLTAIIRDFKSSHPDMERAGAFETGLVEDSLGADGKPVFAHTRGTISVTGPETFDQWYRDVPGVNLKFLVPLQLVRTSAGVSAFDSNAFFPIDGRGWPGDEVLGHNFHFTTEIRVQFVYGGGETFTFRGDDDVFVFVNGKLAIDLGGLHMPREATIDFDARAEELGLEPGGTYSLDVFHAERHTNRSNFRIETSIDCFASS